MTTSDGAPRQRIGPYPGAQRRFMATPADIALMGGAASGGKSFVLLLEALRHRANPLFRAIYFRRTSADLKKPRGLWDTSRLIYPHFGARSREDELAWRFLSGAWVKMNHLEHEGDVHDHQGAEYGLLGIDEAAHFSGFSFWYLQSRVRASLAARLKAYTRLTANPHPDSFLMTELLDPAGFIDEEGFPRQEMSGVLRWYVRNPRTEELVWGSSPEDLLARHRDAIEPIRTEQAKMLGVHVDKVPLRRLCKSFTFVPCKVTDNPGADPNYMTQLQSLPRIERMRLLYGNWRVREAAGEFFKEEMFPIVDGPPGDAVRRVRFWDLAASRRKRSDHTAGVLMSLTANGLYCVEDVVELHLRPHGTEQEIARIAQRDGVTTEIWLEQEVGAAAAFVIDHLQRDVLRGFAVYGLSVTQLGIKTERAKPLSSAAEKGHVSVVRATWNRPLFGQLAAFPSPGIHDDQVDATSGAFHALQAAAFAAGTAKVAR
jgi:predicted phage terminase large subunit-like protein